MKDSHPFLAVVFDFDGVIADTERQHYEAFIRTFSELGIAFSWQTYCDRYLHYGDRQFFQAVASDHGLQLGVAQIDLLVQEKAGHFEAVQGAGAPGLFPGIPELIQGLYDRDIPMGLCSSGSCHDIDPVLVHYDLEKYFQVRVTIEDVQVGKPSPEGYQRACAGLRNPEGPVLPFSRIVAIEDSPGGIQAAHDAGMGTVGICSSYPPEKIAHADRVFPAVAKLSVEQLLFPGGVPGDASS